jgi:hypothetical protein
MPAHRGMPAQIEPVVAAAAAATAAAAAAVAAAAGVFIAAYLHSYRTTLVTPTECLVWTLIIIVCPMLGRDTRDKHACSVCEPRDPPTVAKAVHPSWPCVATMRMRRLLKSSWQLQLERTDGRPATLFTRRKKFCL